jgi:hypothetical protein
MGTSSIWRSVLQIDGGDVTARRDIIDGRWSTTDAGMYSICLSVDATDGGPEEDLNGTWVRDRGAGMYTAPELSDFLLVFEAGARET